MSLPKKLLLRALATALVLSPVAVGCAANDGPLSFDLDNDAGADAAADGGNVEPEVDAGAPDTGPPATRCGNGKKETGEECDDGNRANGDGCSSTCVRESAGPGDLCSNAVEVPLTQQAGGTLYTASVSGSTADLFNHYGATCGGGSGPEMIYKVTSPAVGRAVARVVSPFAAVLSARSGCEDIKTELACKNPTVAGAATDIAFPIFPNAPVYFMVDGFGGSKGDFLLDIEVQTAFCGNGLAEYPETCDDGNTVDGDGCSSTCALEDTSSASACPGMPYRVTTTASFAGDTSTLAHGGGNATGCASTGAGPNAIHAITPTVTGALKLDLLANYPNALLHIRRECAGTTNDSQFDCAGATDALTPLTSTVPVFAEQTVYVFVDSNATSNAGLYSLNATLTPAACGNDLVDGGEECDDGNTVDGDGCSSTCTVERSAESYTCPGKPIRLESDMPGPRTLRVRGTTVPAPGETLPASKWSSTTTAHCQSTARDVVYELTSDIDGYLEVTVGGGQANLFASLRAACVTPQATAPIDGTCSKASTGNGPKTFFAAVDKDTPYYLVVDGNAPGVEGAFVLDLEIKPSVCGNGVVEGGETCDDGATDDGDGCSATCQLEAEKARNFCSTAPPVTYVANPDGTYSAKIVSGTTNLDHATTGGTSTHTLSPCSSNGPDAWFDVAAPISGVLTATITEATFRSAVGVRNGCGTGTGPQLACDAAISNGGQQVVVPVNAGQPYRVIVDGQNVTGTVQRGRFTLDLHIAPSGCGDTFVAGAGTATRRGVATVQTTGLASNVASACGGSGPEGIVRVVSDVSGVLEARATANYSILLYGRNQCADVMTEIPRACSSNLGVFTTAVQKDVPVYLFVDGINGASGAAKIQFTVTP